MRTDFSIVTDGEEYTFKVETWQDALNEFLDVCNASGFTIDKCLQKKIVELAKFKRVSV